VEKPLAAGHEVRVLTRNPAKVQELDGAEVVSGEIEGAPSLEATSEVCGGIFLQPPLLKFSLDAGLATVIEAVPLEPTTLTTWGHRHREAFSR
jgi:uncharacterized protein YbjT (DUF2867 family)